jgi:hypothetical protein
MVQDLLIELYRRGIRLRLGGDQLDVVAPTGALTPELLRRLWSQRDELIALLRGETGGEPATAQAEAVSAPAERGERADPDKRADSGRPTELGDRGEPFSLAAVENAYRVGRETAVQHGGECHFYCELDSDDLDPDRLSSSLHGVIARHAALRTVVQPDGRQRVLPEVPPYRIPVVDLRGLSPRTQQAETERIRAEMSRQVRTNNRWPLFEFRAARLDDRRLRLYVSLDVLILDLLSLSLLFEQWRYFYERLDEAFAPLESTCRT